jgi:hypothetical protein
MKILSLICIIGGAFFAYSIFPNQYVQETRIQDPIHKEISVTQDSISWFDKYLDIYIEEHLFTFSLTKYVHEPTDEVKDELSLECWLGNFTISDMTSDKNLITVNCSNEEQGFNKFIYITPNYFLITLYLTSENGMQYGSSIVYNPEKNTIDKLEGIMVTEVLGDRIEGLREHYSDTDGYVIEYGHYNRSTKKFIVEYSE